MTADVIHDGDDVLVTSGQPSSLTSFSETVDDLMETVFWLIRTISCQQPLKPDDITYFDQSINPPVNRLINRSINQAIKSF